MRHQRIIEWLAPLDIAGLQRVGKELRNQTQTAPPDPALEGSVPILNAMRDLDAMERAIAVEWIKGPVLMVSGRDDQIWPSFELAEIARRRLEAHNHPWPRPPGLFRDRLGFTI